MKKLMFLALASSLLFACSNNDDPSLDLDNPDNVIPEGGILFEISAVNKLDNGIQTRGNVYSQDATQHVTRVVVHAFVKNGADYTFSKSYDIAGWTDGTTLKRYTVVDAADKLPAGDYMFLAIGRPAEDSYTIVTPTSSTTYSSMVASIANSGNEVELFAGSTAATVLAQGSRVAVQMTRKVAGVLGYFKNIPRNLNGTDVRYLRLNVTNANQQVNLTNGVGINTAATPYNIINIDLFAQTYPDGIYTGNDLSGQGVIKVANSQLSGSYFMPVSGVQLTLGLYDTNEVALKTWVVKDSDTGSNNFNIVANNFYSLGKKLKAGNINGGDGDPSNDDDPIDLLTDQSIVVTISPAWEVIHDLIIE